jgi:hypothetical protein
MLIEMEFTSIMLPGICLNVEFVDLLDPNSQRPTIENLGPILSHGGRKLFSSTLLVVVEGMPFPPYIYVGRAAP